MSPEVLTPAQEATLLATNGRFTSNSGTLLTPAESAQQQLIFQGEPISRRMLKGLNDFANQTMTGIKVLSKDFRRSPSQFTLDGVVSILKNVLDPLARASLALSPAALPLINLDSVAPRAVIIAGESSILPAEPEQLLGPKTPTPTNTPRPLRPTFTPTRPRPTPEATATPMPIQFEAPVIIDAPMPSSTFTVHTSNVDDINLRRTPEIDPKNKIRLVKKNEKIYRTGKEVDGWVEMFLPTEGIFAFASASVFSSTNISPTIQERIAFQKFDTAPSTQISSTAESIVTSFNNATGLGGSSDENAKIDGLIDSFWGSPQIRTQAKSDAFKALQANIAVAAQTFSVDSHEPNIDIYGNHVYMAQDTSGSYFATSLRMGAGTNAVFMVTTTKKGEDGSIQADQFEFYNWAGIVKKMGSLDSAWKMGNSIGQFDPRYFRLTLNGQILTGSPEGSGAMKFFEDIEAFNDGKEQSVPVSTPVAPTSTPTSPKPTPIPTQPAPGEGVVDRRLSGVPKLQYQNNTLLPEWSDDWEIPVWKDPSTGEVIRVWESVTQEPLVSSTAGRLSVMSKPETLNEGYDLSATSAAGGNRFADTFLTEFQRLTGMDTTGKSLQVIFVGDGDLSEAEKKDRNAIKISDFGWQLPAQVAEDHVKIIFASDLGLDWVKYLEDQNITAEQLGTDLKGLKTWWLLNTVLRGLAYPGGNIAQIPPTIDAPKFGIFAKASELTRPGLVRPYVEGKMKLSSSEQIASATSFINAIIGDTTNLSISTKAHLPVEIQ